MLNYWDRRGEKRCYLGTILQLNESHLSIDSHRYTRLVLSEISIYFGLISSYIECSRRFLVGLGLETEVGRGKVGEAKCGRQSEKAENDDEY